MIGDNGYRTDFDQELFNETLGLALQTLDEYEIYAEAKPILYLKIKDPMSNKGVARKFDNDKNRKYINEKLDEILKEYMEARGALFKLVKDQNQFFSDLDDKHKGCYLIVAGDEVTFVEQNGDRIQLNNPEDAVYAWRLNIKDMNKHDRRLDCQSRASMVNEQMVNKRADTPRYNRKTTLMIAGSKKTEFTNKVEKILRELPDIKILKP